MQPPDSTAHGVDILGYPVHPNIQNPRWLVILDSHLSNMSAYLRAAKPLLRYMARRYRGFLSIRSRIRRRGLKRTLSGASRANPGPGADGIKVVNFKFGRRPLRTNLKQCLRLQKNLVPINTHLINVEQISQQEKAGKCKWTLLGAGGPGDIQDALSKGYQAATSRGSGNDAAGVTITGAAGNVYDGHGWEGKINFYSYDAMLKLKNSAQFQVNLQVYECIARQNIPATATNPTVQDIFSNGWKKHYPSATYGNMNETNEDATLYMNPDFCHWFKIQKVRNVVLKAGEILEMNLTHAMPRCVNTLLLGNDPNYLALGGFTRAVVIKQLGSLVHVTRTIGGTATEGVDCGGSQIDIRWMRKYRWNALNPVHGVITNTDALAASDAAIADQSAYDPSDGNATTNFQI